MSYNLPSKVLLTITSYNEKFYDDGKKTGLYFTEAWHPYKIFTENGFEVDFISETGTYGFDEHSILPNAITKEDYKVFQDKNHPFMIKLNNLLTPSKINPDDYGIFYASAGHATLYDYPKAKGLISIAEKINKNGGIISAVCHGPIILPFINDVNGFSIVKGKTITGFSTAGEIQLNVLKNIKADGVKTLEEIITEFGGKYIPPEDPLGVCIKEENRLLTGANPASAGPLAEAVVKVFKNKNM
jgi:putative intracellular protease/amidase